MLRYVSSSLMSSKPCGTPADDDNVPGRNRQAVAGFEGAVGARPDGDLHDFDVGRERHRLDHLAAGDERRRPETT